MKVYLVYSGDDVAAVFTDSDKAHQYIDMAETVDEWFDGSVSELDTDEFEKRMIITPGNKCFGINFRPDGTVFSYSCTDMIDVNLPRNCKVRRNLTQYWAVVNISAPDYETAVEIGREVLKDEK